MKTLWYMVFKITSVHYFSIEGHCDLNLWPSDPKINRCHLILLTILYMKYEDFVINGFQDNHLLVIINHIVKYENLKINCFQENERKPFCHWRSQLLWPSDPKINRGHLLVMTNLHVKYEDFVIYSFQDNLRKPYGLPTDWQTNQH